MKHIRISALLFLYFSLVAVAVVATDSVEVKVTKTNIGDTSAVLEWKTSELAVSVFELDEKSVTFAESDRFKVELSSLEPEKSYSYKITACANSQDCYIYAGSFVTAIKSEEQQSAFTGMAVVDSMPADISSLFFYGILCIVVLVVIFNLAFQSASQMEISFLPVSSKVNSMINKAENAIRTGKHKEAYELYSSIRPVYEKLNLRTKAKHYDRLMDIHEKLELFSKAQEANYLADKYVNNTITLEEMSRLRDLLME